MATNQSLINQMNNQPQQVKPQQMGLKALLSSESVQEKFKAVLKNKAAGFTSSVLTLVNNNSYLADAEPMSIMTGAMVAATLDLPLDQNLGYAYLVPFNTKVGNKWVKKANFILGYKGYIQLAQRSGQYKSLNVVSVYEGQLKSWNPLTEEFEFDYDGRKSDSVIGYVGYFKLLNGFEKTTYWTVDQIKEHRVKNAKGKDKENPFSGNWGENFDAMAQKTVIRNLLSKWGILSIEMQNAVVADEKEVDFDSNGQIVDVTESVNELEQNKEEVIHPDNKELADQELAEEVEKQAEIDPKVQMAIELALGKLADVTGPNYTQDDLIKDTLTRKGLNSISEIKPLDITEVAKIIHKEMSA